MSSAQWSQGGRILYNASRVYYVSDEPSLPPLRWMAERQQFEHLRSANSEDVELRASIAELAQSCTPLQHLPSVQQPSVAASLSCYLPCEALYGVLPLGSANSALVYVTAKSFVCFLHVGGMTHAVYAVKGLQWLHLPCVTSSATSQRRRRRREGCRNGRNGSGGGMREDGGGDKSKNGTRRAERGARRAERESTEDEEEEEDDDDATTTTTTDTDAEDDVSEEVGRLPSKTVNDYLAVLHRFCEAVNTQDETQSDDNGGDAAATAETVLPGIAGAANRFSYLYYSPTLDLSANPVHLLGHLTNTPHPSLSLADTYTGKAESASPSLSSTSHRDSATGGEGGAEAAEAQRAPHRAWDDLRAAATTKQLYQWNSPLLSDGFALPTMAALQKELDVQQRHRDPESGKTISSPGEARVPWRDVCVEEVQRHARPHHGTTPSPSSLPLYVPSFIRGLVAQTEAHPLLDMTLLTRVCCRWAGTRYNRRGLEPGHSGVVANMSMTSLWVTPQSPVSTASFNAPQSAFAVYTVMRGSVPRRWEQPANLALKPPIKISPISSAAEEMGRHVRLLRQCMPEMQALLCLDTMSQSKLEEPLAEAFAAAVRRYVEGTPKSGTSPATSIVMEEKDGAAAAHAGADEVVNNASGCVPDRELAVLLVKFNVKKELKTHHYETMMRRCLAEMDTAAAAAAGSGAWMDFTKGRVRHTENADEAEKVTTAHPSTSLSSQLQLEQVQRHLVRVNCLDCLDRTNLVQSILLCAVLPRMLAYVEDTAAAAVDEAVDGKSTTTADCTDVALHHSAYAAASYRLRLLLAAQGTAISQLYAGTEPHFIPYMLNGRHHWSHKAVEGVLAQRRWYQQNFFDGVKQDGISLLTRQHNPQVFNADIESPFSRDLSGMNRQVMYGLLLGILPFLYSLMVCCSEHRFASPAFQLHFAICIGWVVYLSVLYNKLMRYRVTYTNRPLLLYTRQAEWC